MGGFRCRREVQGYFNLCFAVRKSWLKLGSLFPPFLKWALKIFLSPSLMPKVLVGRAHQEPVRCINTYVIAEAPPLRLNSLTGEPLTPKTEPPNQSWTEPITPTGKSCVLAIAYMYIHNVSISGVSSPSHTAC